MKKLRLAIIALFCVVLTLALHSCKKKVDAPVDNSSALPNVVISSDSATVNTRWIVPGQECLLGSVVITASDSWFFSGVKYEFRFDKGMDASFISSTRIVLSQAGKADQSLTQTKPYGGFVSNSATPKKVYGIGNYIVKIFGFVNSNVPQGALLSTSITLDYNVINPVDNDVHLPLQQACNIVFGTVPVVTGSLSTAITTGNPAKTIVSGVASQTLFGTFTATGTAMKVSALSLSVVDSLNLQKIDVHINNVLVGTKNTTGQIVFTTPITVAAGTSVPFTVKVTPSVSAINSSMQTSLYGIVYADANAIGGIDWAKYTGDQYIAYPTLPTMNIIYQPVQSQTLTDNKFKELYSFNLSAGRYKQCTIQFTFNDQVNTNSDSMRIDSLVFYVNRVRRNDIVFTINKADTTTISKRNSIVTITFQKGMAELVLNSTATISLSGIPRKFGVGTGNGLIIEGVTDNTPTQSNYLKLFSDGTIGGKAAGLGLSSSQMTSASFIWSTNSAGASHSALTNTSSADWYNGYGVTAPAQQILYTN